VSIKTFVERLAAVDVAGVKRQYTYPPLQITSSDVPASFVRPPASNYAPLSTCDDTADEMVCELVIAVEAAGQNEQPANYAAILTMADALNDALRDEQLDIGALVTWRIAAQNERPIIIGATPFWGVSALVTKRG
jgi:hypothetical protein